ncbi:15985_t:CDS:2 [Entrophospora sp. SA101]|nr:15985_t:CDS:2 [Entrophospora sp. SA101]
MSTQKRTSLSVSQKHELCEKEHWLSITSEWDDLKKFSYDDFQDGTANALADYTIYNALINAADAWSNVSSQTICNCWLKTGILPERTIVEPSSINDEDEEKDLEMLLEKLPNGEDLSANEYINIEDWMSLTDENIIEMQELEFGEVDDEIRVLRRLNRRIGLAIQKNLKQPGLHHYFEDKIIE